MKRMLILQISVLAAALLSGCVGISVGNKETKAPAPHGPPPVIVAGDPADQATIAEIDAAAGLNMENARADALCAIAHRPSLTQASQVHLANAAYKRLSHDHNKVEVLDALIRNPAFCAPAKQTIMAQLGKLASDKDRQAILAAANEREAKK